MSLWYDIKNKNYSSDGKSSWIRAYADTITDNLRKDCDEKFDGHFSGACDRHKASDVDCENGNTVQNAIDTETAERKSEDNAIRDAIDEKANAITDEFKREIENVKNQGLIEKNLINSTIESTKEELEQTITTKTEAIPVRDLTGKSVVTGESQTETAKEGATVVGDVRGVTYNDGMMTSGNVAIGKYSTAIGSGCAAKGDYSTAAGGNNTASGQNSVAMGGENIVNAGFSTAMGYANKTTAAANNSVAMGGGNIVRSTGTVALGTANDVIGECASAIGRKNIVDGPYSAAIGYNNQIAGNYSTSMGFSNKLNSTTASTAMGNFSTVNGNCSVAMGYYAWASGQNALAQGNHTQAYHNQVAIGHYNRCGTEGSDSGISGDAFHIGNGVINAQYRDAFRVTYAGDVYGCSAYNSEGADYAEYFEWIDGNTNNEDRRGRLVTLDGDKIRLATADDDYILGVVSAIPAVVGDVYDQNWQGKYLTDEYGKKLTQTVHIPAQYEDIEEVDPETGETVTKRIVVENEHDSVQWVLNPEYDESEEYVSREERQEWSAVGLVGKLVVEDDGTATVNGFVKAGSDGIATKTEDRNGYRVMKRINDTHIQVLAK